MAELTAGDRAKALEPILAAAKFALEYYESSARQIEDKSRNNLAFATSVVGIGALIARTDEFIKFLRPISKTVNGTLVLIYSPSVWVYLAILPLLYSLCLAIYIAYLNYKIQSPKQFEMLKTADLKTLFEAISENNSENLIPNSIRRVGDAYIASANTASNIQKNKSIFLKKQNIIILQILISTALYIIFALLLISNTPDIR
jgi:hypothetical protein